MMCTVFVQVDKANLEIRVTNVRLKQTVNQVACFLYIAELYNLYTPS